MKLSSMFAAAGLVLASLGVSTVADAQPPQRHDQRHDRDDRRDRRHGDRYQRHDNGNHYGQRKWRKHRVTCRTYYRNGRRQRVCR